MAELTPLDIFKRAEEEWKNGNCYFTAEINALSNDDWSGYRRWDNARRNSRNQSIAGHDESTRRVMECLENMRTIGHT